MSRARNLIQNWMACAKVIERMPPAVTAVSTTAHTSRPPSQPGALSWVLRVRLAPASCGTM
jgi:hypothetical protein